MKNYIAAKQPRASAKLVGLFGATVRFYTAANVERRFDVNEKKSRKITFPREFLRRLNIFERNILFEVQPLTRSDTCNASERPSSASVIILTHEIR